MAIKRLSTILLLFFACTAFAQSWQSKEAVRIENTESSFHYTFRDSTTLYIQKQNISYIVSLPNSNYIQVGYLYEGATSKIMSCTYNTLTQPALGSNAELADTLNAWLNEPSSGGGGGGVQSVVAGTNITIDNTDPLNPTISVIPDFRIVNNFVIVTESRDFNTGDLDKILVVVSNDVELTLPSGEWAEGFHNIIILPLGVDNLSFQSSFGGSMIHMFTPSGTGPEIKLLITTIPPPGGQTTLLDIGQGDLLDTTDSLNKTTTRYLMDNINNFIPGDLQSVCDNGYETTTNMTVGGTLVVKNNATFGSPVNAGHIEIYDQNNSGNIITIFGPNNAGIGGNITLPEMSTGNYLPISVNGNNADINGNITLPIDVGYRGTATLSSGTVTVNTVDVHTGYKIYVSVNTPSGTQGFLSASTADIIDGTSFVINSTSATDDSTVNWWIAP